MDLLGGYGSGSDNDEEEQVKQRQKQQSSSSGSSGSVSDVLKSISATTAAIPVVKDAKRKRVQILFDMPTSNPSNEDDDDNQDNDRAKKPKEEGKPSSGLFSFLPAPKSKVAPKPDGGGEGNAANAALKSTGMVPLAVGKKNKSSLKLPLPTSSGPSTSIPSSTSVESKPAAPTHSTEPDDDSAEESFFTLDTPATDVPPTTADLNFPKKSLAPIHTAGNTAASSSASSQYAYSESYQSNEYTDPYAYTGAYEGGGQPTSWMDETALRKLGHRPKDGPIKFLDVNQAEQVGEEWKLEAAKALTSGMPSQSIAHLKPSNLGKRRHNIMALAHEAKAREQQLQEQYAQRKISKAIARTKYGF
ncbi:hypothetical protein HDV05_008396 [Chytridiales sp. JEL 0842]|nr:hypothetical protein HDV05_008396 [Chytridiales sp. JEL 0842]